MNTPWGAEISLATPAFHIWLRDILISVPGITFLTPCGVRAGTGTMLGMGGRVYPSAPRLKILPAQRHTIVRINHEIEQPVERGGACNKITIVLGSESELPIPRPRPLSIHSDIVVGGPHKIYSSLVLLQRAEPILPFHTNPWLCGIEPASSIYQLPWTVALAHTRAAVDSGVFVCIHPLQLRGSAAIEAPCGQVYK